MVPIKIECVCGQSYAFEIEPINGRMPHAIACPTCSADGTAAANSIITQTLPQAVPLAVPVATPVAAPARSGMRLVAAIPSASAPAATSVSNILLKERSQVDHEAKAKIFWGDEPDSVVKFIMMHGVPYQEASEVVAGFVAERAAITRVSGIRKIVIGCCLVAVPIIAALVFMSIGFFPVKIFGLTVAVGLYGGYLLLTGIMMLVAPKIETGDVSEL